MRNPQEDLQFFEAKRFNGSKVKEIAEYWINRAQEVDLQRDAVQTVVGMYVPDYYELRQRLEQTEKALELACERLYEFDDMTDSDEVYRENCKTIGETYQAIANGFLAKAKEVESNG